MICEVCNKNPSIGFVASAFGPMSFAICQPCLEAGAEPPAAMAYLVEISEGDLSRLNSWVAANAKTFHQGKYQSLQDWIIASSTRPPA